MSNVVLKDKGLQDYYEDLFGMYATPGWRKLMEDVGRMEETHDTLTGLETSEQLWFRHGQLEIIRHFKNHQTTHELAYNEMLAEQEGTEVEPSTGGVAKAVS